jgi:hypothetical protein
MEKSIIVLFLAAVLTACVTINIYFPAAAAQEAADKIIDDVWKIKADDLDNLATPSDTTELPEK